MQQFAVSVLLVLVDVGWLGCTQVDYQLACNRRTGASLCGVCGVGVCTGAVWSV